MKTAVIYARYSSDSQSEQSIEGQLRVCQDYAKNNNILILNTYIDRAMTGTNDSRPDFQRMLKDSNKKAWELVLVYKLDRFSRNKYEMAVHKKTLKDNGIKLISAMEYIPDSPEAILIESMLEGYAEYYSAELSQKVRRGMNESRHKGNFTGGNLLYGYKVENKKVLIDEDKAEIVKYIFEQYANGIYVKDIIKELTNKGIYHRNKPFARTTIYSMLANEKYAGIYRHNDEVFTNIYPRIVPHNIYAIVRKRIEENHYGKHDDSVNYLLRNRFKCGICGSTIASESGTARNGNIQRYYKCSGRKKMSICKQKPIRKEVIEQLIIDTTFKCFSSTETINLLAERILDFHKQQSEDNSTLNILQKEKENIEKSIDNLLSCMEQGIVTQSTKQRIVELENKLNIVSNNILIERAKHKLELKKEDIVKFIKSSLKKEPRQLIRLLVKEVVLYEDKIEIYYNYIDNKKGLDDNEHQSFSFFNDIFEIVIDEQKFSAKQYKIKLNVIALI